MPQLKFKRSAPAQSRLYSTLTLQYVLALVLVALLSIAAYTSVNRAVQSQDSSAALLNIGGRQRMLSQQIALFSQNLANPGTPNDRAIYREKLVNAVELMEKSHEGLTRGNPDMDLPSKLSDEVRALYFDPPLELDHQVRVYLSKARALLNAPESALTPANPDLAYILEMAQPTLLNALDQMVSQYQHESEAKVSNLHFMVMVVVGFILLVLLLEALLIFRPMVRRVDRENRSLVHSQRQLDGVLDTVGEAIIIVDEANIVLRVNQEVCNISGYSQEEIVGKKAVLFLSAQSRENFRGMIPEILGQRLEMEGVKKDGTAFPIEVRVSENRMDDQPRYILAVRDITARKQAEEALRQANDRLEEQIEVRTAELVKANLALRHEIAERIKAEEAVGQARDQLEIRVEERTGELATANLSLQAEIEERKQAEERLKESEAKNRAILNALPDLMFRLDKNGRYLDYKAPREEDLVFSPQFFMGKNLWEVVPGELAHRVMGYIDQAFQSNEIQVFEYQLSSKDIIFDYEGRLVVSGEDEVIMVVRNITERKKIERLKSEFISTVSHELRTPLTSIRGSLGLILGGVAGAVSPEVQMMIDIAYKNSERLVLLINDILDIEKIESGKLVFNSKPLELKPLIEQALEANASYATQYGVGFSLGQSLADVKIMGDSDRLMQVFANLLSNAAKFSPKGEKVIVSVEQLDNRIRISVNDRGSGIPVEFRSRIFQKFAQADSSNTRQKGGTGLGLSISKAIVEKLGGQMGFESVPGQGTTFYFELPEWREEAPVKQRDNLILPPPPRILICEDNQDVALLIRIMLEDSGFECDLAYNVEQARKLLSKHQYTAITLDLMLPDQNGLSFIQELRTQEATAKLPVVVISAWATSGRELELTGPTLTVLDWIDKPIDEERLLKALRQATRQITGGGSPRILHVEDDPDILEVIGALLAEVGELSHAATLKQAQQKLQLQNFDMIILDLDLPDGSGLDLLEMLRTQTHSLPPIVIFSAQEVGFEIARQVAATLVKSRTSNQDLLNTIKGLVSYNETVPSK